MRIRVLGCSGAIAKDCRTTSFLIDDDTLIDAGTGVGDLSLEEMRRIERVFLTHSHLDHVAALPLMVDAVGAGRNHPLQINALPGTIQALQAHIFNDVIWPDFSRIPSESAPFIRFQEIAIGQTLLAGDKRVDEVITAQIGRYWYIRFHSSEALHNTIVGTTAPQRHPVPDGSLK